VSLLSNLLLVVLAVWYFLDRFHIFGISTELPIGNIAIFFAGVITIVNYFLKSEVHIVFWSAPAGGYSEPKRLIGLAFGLFLVIWMIFYHFKGWML
jgi:hypothetical protein